MLDRFKAWAKPLFSPVSQDAPAAVNVRDVSAGQNVTVETHYHLPAPAMTDETAQFDALEITYLECLFERLKQLNLSGINLSSAGQQQRCVSLAEVYTALWTRSADAGRGDAFAIDGRERLRSALDMLNETPRLVLLGEPGSGKSTFVDFVALCLAGQRLNDPCANLERLIAPMPDERKKEKPTPQTWAHGALIPIKIVLRDFAANTPNFDPSNAVNAFMEFIRRELDRDGHAECAKALLRALNAGRALVMFDGLDEVPEADHRREQIIAAVEQFAKANRKTRLLVTCRTYAYHRQQWALQDFTATALAPFTDPQITQFIEVWYQHLAALKQVEESRAEGNAAD